MASLFYAPSADIPTQEILRFFEKTIDLLYLV